MEQKYYYFNAELRHNMGKMLEFNGVSDRHPTDLILEIAEKKNELMDDESRAMLGEINLQTVITFYAEIDKAQYDKLKPLFDDGVKMFERAMKENMGEDEDENSD